MQWLKASKRMENLENPTVDKIRRVMNLIFKHGQTYGLIPRTGEANPMKFVRVKTQSEYEAKIITPEQCFRILMAMPQPERTITMLIAATGLRISECLGLQWADVDYDSQQIFVRRSWTGGKVGKPKSAASKAPVPLVPLLAGFIRLWQEQTPYAPTDGLGFCQHPAKGQATARRQHAGRRSSPSGCGEGECAQGRREGTLRVPQPTAQLGKLPRAEGDRREDSTKDASPQRRCYDARNLRPQHERRSSSSAG